MAKDKTKCWYCGSSNLEPVESWQQCRDCGATISDLSKISSALITVEDMETARSPRPGKETHPRPSGQAMRAAARAREER